MSARLTLTLGAVFFLLGFAGFFYLLARPRPLVVPGASDVLPFEAPQPSPTSESTPEEEKPKESPRPTPAGTPIPRFDVRLVSPNMTETFVSPAIVTIEASTQPNNQVAKVTFYSTAVASQGRSVCRSLTELDPNWNSPLLLGDPPPTRIGETNTAPYRLIWNVETAGIYDVRAIATYRSGLQQISPPVVIVVNPDENYESTDWKGWRPPYPKDQIAELDAELMPSATPTPACPEIKVYTLNPSPPAGSLVTFRADVVGGDLDGKLKYRWNAIGGEILGGQDTSTITVSTTGSLERAAAVTVEVGGFGQACTSTASLSVPVVQPRWLTDNVRAFLKQHVSRIAPFGVELKQETDARGYVVVWGQQGNCLSPETIGQARLLKNYLVDLHGLAFDRIVLVQRPSPAEDEEFGEFEGLEYSLWIVPKGAELPEDIQAAPIVPCLAGLSSPLLRHDERFFNRTCPDVIERIRFSTAIVSGGGEINVCPYNPSDPQNDATVTTVVNRAPHGRYANFPAFNYWTNGGKIVGAGMSSIWDLSDVKLRPGWYFAIVEADDGCDCSAVAATKVTITNFCTPCLTGGRVCKEAGPENGRQVFGANIEDFATMPGNPSFRWETSEGIIIDGQGTQRVTIDTSHLAKGTKFLVTARVRGLRRYCVNKLSFHAVAGDPCEGPPARKFDEYGNISGEGLPAKRRKPETPPPTNIGDETSVDSGTGEPRTPDESELIKVAWSPKVKTDESFAIVVNYNRVKDAVRISNQAGEIVEELRSGAAFKLLKDKYGPEYRVLANVRIESAGIDCSYCREQYQVLDNENVEWSCSVSPRRAGTQTFNVELWVKGEARQPAGAAAKEPEKVWSKNNLKVEVSAPLITKTTVFASASLCVVLGLGLSLRWLRIYRIGDTYNVGQAVAVGRNVRIENATVNQNAQNQANQSQKEDENG